MNLKSNILKITVVIALIFILIPVIAAEDVDDSVYTEEVDDSVTEAIDDSVSAEDSDETNDDLGESLDDNLEETLDDDPVEATTDENNENPDETEDLLQEAETTGYGNDDVLLADAAAGEQSADLQISVMTPDKKLKVGDVTVVGMFVYNKGPDTASNVIVRSKLLSGTLQIITAMPSKGNFFVYKGILYWYIGDLAPGEFASLVIPAEVVSEEDIEILAIVTSDTPDPDLSNNVAFGYIDVAGDEVEEASEVMPATGNPIALALLALLSVVGVSLRRKF